MSPAYIYINAYIEICGYGARINGNNLFGTQTKGCNKFDRRQAHGQGVRYFVYLSQGRRARLYRYGLQRVQIFQAGNFSAHKERCKDRAGRGFSQIRKGRTASAAQRAAALSPAELPAFELPSASKQTKLRRIRIKSPATAGFFNNMFNWFNSAQVERKL